MYQAKKFGLFLEGSGKPLKGLKQENDILRFTFEKTALSKMNWRMQG